MGISNELFPTERDLNPTCQTASTPNDVSGRTGLGTPDSTLSDIEKFAVFMRFLAPPAPSTTTPGGADSISRGRTLFGSVGCAMCHTPSLSTGGAQVAALANKNVPLYSDLALHHMGAGLADNILQGSAGPDEFRTAPLWGLGQRIFLLHDGRTKDLNAAIQAHAGGGSWNPHGTGFPGGPGGAAGGPPSEANRVVSNFNGLNDVSRQDLLNFLRSL